ncbi:MAG: hypothetical protein ACRC2U_18605, partial [Aeromonas sp.]
MQSTCLFVIETLTPEQELLIPQIHQKWIDLQTQPIDRPKAKDAIDRLYKFADQPPPNIIFVASPASAALLLHLIKNAPQIVDRASLRASLGASLRASLGASLRASLGASLGAGLRD